MPKVKAEQSFADKIIEQYGSDFIEQEETADEIKQLHVIHTGSTSLDVSLGVGGVPLGRFTTVYGPESSAKTTLCLSIAKHAIEDEGINVLYVDPEMTLDYKYAETIIGEFDHSKLVLVKPETAEQTFMICEEGIADGRFQLIILDSIGALAPSKEKEDDFEKAGVGVIPRMLSKFLRRNAYDVKKKNIAFVFVNQIRAVIGAYVPTNEMPGGNALRHFSSIVIYLTRSEILKFGDEAVGAVSRYTIKKNKVGVPFRNHTFTLMYGVGINNERDTVEFATLQGVVEKRGSYFYFQGELLGQGLVKAEQYLKEHKEVLDKISEVCYNINSKKQLEERSEDEPEPKIAETVHSGPVSEPNN
jgi:recombination protein RecA